MNVNFLTKNIAYILNIKHRIATLLISLLMLVGLATFASGDHKTENHEKKEHEEIAKGPHNGRLLQDGDFTLELAIFERDVPPEYRAWASNDGKIISSKDWQLSVELTRLSASPTGSNLEKFNFTAQDDFLRSQNEVKEPHSFDVSVTATYKNKKHHWAFPSYEGRVQLNADLAKKSGITTATANAGKIQKTLKVYGQVKTDPDQVRQLKARFPGVIRSVNTRLGAQVNAGDILARVEANESLRTYTITAPISGVVISRNANEGEATSEQPLFTVANHNQVVIDFPIFPQDAARVKLGQKIRVQLNNKIIHSSIASLTPDANNSPTLTARITLDNTHKEWAAGIWVDAFIATTEISAPLVIDNRALQKFRDWQVVFIQVGDTYEIRPLELGASDGEFTEVISGLNTGDHYVVENSYLLKADLEKSGASHDH